MNDYNLIADQYFEEFGTELEDVELINKFETYLDKNSFIVDLGGGAGKLSNYFIQNGFKSTCYDFSENMQKHAKESFPNVPFILDDILNIKNHFKENSVDGIIAMYSLFHIPKEDINKLFSDINYVLKDNGIFCFSFQLGADEDFVDEPYLKEKGKNVLYMNYLTKSKIYELVKNNGYEILFETEKHETGDNVIGEDGNDAIYIIARKNDSIHIIKNIVEIELNKYKNDIENINEEKTIDCITIFSSSEEDYIKLNNALNNNKLIDQMTSGNLYYLYEPIKTMYGNLSFIKIRKHDDNYNNYRISVDFTIKDYNIYKNKLDNPIIKKYDTFELIQFKNDKSIINIINLSAKDDYKL